jgi:hypothetical protein
MYIKNLSNEEMTNIKVVDLYDSYNFDIHHFSFEIIWGFKLWLELVLFQISKFELLKISQMTIWSK